MATLYAPVCGASLRHLWETESRTHLQQRLLLGSEAGVSPEGRLGNSGREEGGGGMGRSSTFRSPDSIHPPVLRGTESHSSVDVAGAETALMDTGD